MRPASGRQLVFIDPAPGEIEALASQLSSMAWDVRVCESLEAVDVSGDLDPRAFVVDESALSSSGAAQLFQRYSRARVVVMSALPGNLSSRLRAVRVGATAYVDKPPEISALLAKVDDQEIDAQAARIRVLVVEDERLTARHIEHLLKAAGMDATAISKPDALLDTIADFGPDLVLMDMGLPGCTGLELAQVLRHDDRYVSLPIIFLTGDSGQERRLAALDQGVEDYLTKPLEEQRLVAAVRSRAARARVLRGYMDRDGLTGMLDRSALDRRLAREVEVARRRGATLSLGIIDLDFFKRVNDHYGHAFGDRVLRTLALSLRNLLRAGDVVGRYGGEEFVVLLPETSIDDARGVLDRVRRSFAALGLASSGGGGGSTFSAGVAAFPDHASASLLLDAADAALYRAKAAGRNQVCL